MTSTDAIFGTYRADENGLSRYSDQWTAVDLRRRIMDMGESKSHRPATICSHVSLLQRMTAVAPALSLPWPAEDLWPGKSAREVSEYAELSTQAVPPQIWFPLIRAAWAFVHTFAADIFRADRRYQELRDAAQKSVVGKDAELDTWLADQNNTVPVHYEPDRPAGQVPGVNWRLMALNLGVWAERHGALFSPGPRSTARRRAKVLQAVADGRVTHQGLIEDLAEVTRPDGSTGPWHLGIDPYDLHRLRIMLRNAAFTLVVGFLMMRDSEIQEIVRGSVVEHYNSPAIASTLRKGNSSLPRKHWWIAEPVAEAIAVAEAVSVHPDRVFAPLHRKNDAESLDGVWMMAAFIAFVNQGRSWSGLDEIPDGYVRPHMFRRTMSMLTDQFAGSEIALGMQLKHFATRALANTSTLGYAAADSAWAEHLKDAIEVAKFGKLKELYGLHKVGQPIGFGPGAERVKDAFDQVIANVKARGGDARVEEDLLRKIRITIRFGTLNNCLYDGTNPAGAVCLEDAIIPEGHTGPLDERCRPDRCGNSMIGIEHVPIHDSHRRTQLKLLQTPGLPKCRKELVTRELQRVEAVLDKAKEALG
ncbi:integrase [Streptomyces atratus]|uniref:integrase n=1 Tax=Streptomyces atratus TaxID=1893 RepID=UPI0033CCEDB7